jgi:hypothetical protein
MWLMREIKSTCAFYNISNLSDIECQLKVINYRIRISNGDIKMIGLTMFYLQTWVLGEPLDLVLDVPDCLDPPPLSLFILV